jgi:arylsulfatase A-like enzyme
MSLARTRALALLAFAAAYGGAGGCGDPEPPASSPVARYDGSGHLLEGGRRRTALPNVVLVCLDTVRADSIEPVGGEPPAMPALAAFAARSTQFVDASASAAWTGPSVSTLLTGLLPAHHGVHGNLDVPGEGVISSIATLAEYLKAAGYATTACTGGGWVSSKVGLHQGFDSFTPDWTLDDVPGALSRWIATRDAEKPAFLFLHTYDAHDPYGRKRPPEGNEDPERVARTRAFVERLRGPRERTGEFPAELRRDMLLAFRSEPLAHEAMVVAFGRPAVQGAVIAYDRETFPTAPDRDDTSRRLRDAYRRGLRRTDDLFQRTLERLDAANLNPTTVLVVVTDHGEAFGEHDNLGHGRWLYDELVRTVVVFRAPGRMEPGTVVRGSCGLVDVLPTLLDLVGLPLPADLDGRSLLPLAQGREKGHPVLSDEHRIVRHQGSRVRVRLTGARTAGAKWIGTYAPHDGSFREEVYDLREDPLEKAPLAVGDVDRLGPDVAEAVRRGREYAKSLRGEAYSPAEGSEVDR